MSKRKNLENLLTRLDKEREDDRLLILQGIVEKMLTYLLTTIETTEKRMAELANGFNNVAGFLYQQQSDCVGRINSQVPGIDMALPSDPESVIVPPPTAMSPEFMEELKTFIQMTATKCTCMGGPSSTSGAGGAETDVDGAESKVMDDHAAHLHDALEVKEKELASREKYLNRLADQLASRELQLQERERSIEIIEKGLQDKITTAAALQMAGINTDGDVTGEGDEESAPEDVDELEELSALSDSILKGVGVDDRPEDDDLIDELINLSGDPEEDMEE